MADVEIYTKSWCGYSAAALQLLDHKGVQYEHIDVTSDPATELEMMARAGAHTVPQIFIDGQGIGGYNDLAALEASGELDGLLYQDESDTYTTQTAFNGVKNELFQSTH